MTNAPQAGDSRRIVVVGPCAAGKTTLVERLLERGYDARVIAQEHSVIRDLWKKPNPDVVIALDLALEKVRERRSPTWSAAIYRVQHERLEDAFDAADVFIDSGAHSEDDVLELVVDFLYGE